MVTPRWSDESESSEEGEEEEGGMVVEVSEAATSAGRGGGIGGKGVTVYSGERFRCRSWEETAVAAEANRMEEEERASRLFVEKGNRGRVVDRKSLVLNMLCAIE